MKLEIQENVLLAPFTTLEVGGPARYFCVARKEHEIAEAFEFADEKGVETFVLGGGSNILVADAGIDGLVVQVALTGVLSEPRTVAGGSDRLITAQAGQDWDGFVRFCVEQDLAGVECLSGIPGFVGGTPVQNVGAYGQEVSETIVSVRCFDRQERTFVELSNSECGFEYRKSIFNSTHRNRYVALSVTYAMTPGGVPKIVYKDLRDFFGSHSPSLGETREAVLQIRRAKSMVIEPEDPNRRSAGSFYKNPIVSAQRFDEINAEFENVPRFAMADGSVKIPAAWLIENSGFKKGHIHGNAGLSTNHTLAIINRGGATADQIISLNNAIQAAVESQFQIVLQPEPVFVGFSG